MFITWNSQVTKYRGVMSGEVNKACIAHSHPQCGYATGGQQGVHLLGGNDTQVKLNG